MSASIKGCSLKGKLLTRFHKAKSIVSRLNEASLVGAVYCPECGLSAVDYQRIGRRDYASNPSSPAFVESNSSGRHYETVLALTLNRVRGGINYENISPATTEATAVCVSHASPLIQSQFGVVYLCLSINVLFFHFVIRTPDTVYSS